LKQVLKKLVIANAGAYGGQSSTIARPPPAPAPAAISKAKTNKGGTVTKQDWITMGRDLYKDVLTAKDDSINAVCDTCSALVLYIINDIINFRGRFELFAETSIHHHYVVVDRADGSDASDYTTWGGNAFVIDLWQAKFAGREQTD